MKHSLASLFTILTGLGTVCYGQSSYFQAVTNLNPAGYWPLHETAPPIPGDIETNYGTLGAQGTAYYGDWVNRTNVDRQIAGALVNDPDTAANFKGANPSWLLVPHTSPQTSLMPPFSVELWAKPLQNGGGTTGDLIGTGGATLNGGGGDGNAVGFRIYWDSGFTFRLYIGNGTGQGTIAAPGGAATNVWHHLVATCDTSTNFVLYLDGVQANTSSSLVYVPSTWNPLCVGSSFWRSGGPQRQFPGGLDEVAIYTNVLAGADVATHYNVGTNVAAVVGDYRNMILTNNPLLYFRMNSPAYVPPTVATWPVMNNYGSVAQNGVYSPGTAPGTVNGPANPGGIPAMGFDGANATPGNGLNSFGDAGANAGFNPTGTTPLTISAWFKGNPADPRNQTIVGHSDRSWRLFTDTNGKLRFNPGVGGDLTSPKVYNDGNWHHAVGVYNGSNNLLYVDGLLETQNLNVTGSIAGTNLSVMIGADPQYTNNPVGPGRQFAGNVCEVSFWNGTALSAAQVQSLYDAAGVAPSIKTQPVSASVNQNSAFTNVAVITGSAPISYQWYQDNQPRSGKTSAALVLNPVQQSDASPNYYLVATNSYGSVTSAVVSLTVFSSPSIDKQPANTNIILFTGGSASFSLHATGAQPLGYQWVSNNVAVPNATNASFTISNVQFGSPITVNCVVSNFVGTTPSANASISVITPPNQPYPQAVLTANPQSYWRLNEADNFLGNGNPGAVAHDYWGGDNGTYTNVGLGLSGYSQATDPGTTAAYVPYIASVDGMAFNIQDVNFAATNGSSRAFSVEVWANGDTPANDAGIVTKGYGGGGEQFSLDCGGTGHGFRFLVREAGGTTHNASSSIQPANVWHHLVGVCDQPNGLVKLYVDGVLAASATIPINSGILSATNFMSIGSRKSSATTVNDLQFTGALNDVAVYGYALSANQIQAQYLAAGVPPTFTQVPPATATALEGGTLTVSAGVFGTAPLTNQWYDSTTATAIPDQTNSVLVISNVSTSLDGHSVYLALSNQYGSTNSSMTTISIISGPPQITVNLPAQLSIPSGKTYTYSVSAIGTLPFTYQWYNGASPIPDATNSTYSFVVGPPLGSYNYHVLISNSHGSTNSQTSTVTSLQQLSDAYASKIAGLGAVGYWPLRETNAPAPIMMETNLGTLGRLGNAYYATTTTNQSRILFSQSGALSATGDNDPSVYFSNPSGTNFAFVPRVTPVLTTKPPFTWELWLNSGSTAFSDIMSQGGAGLNSAPGAGTFTGFRVSWAGNNGPGPNFQIYAYNGTGGTGAYNSFASPAGSTPFNAWSHCVVTYDGTTFIIYVNGVQAATADFPLAINNSAPLTIGDGRWQGDATATVGTRGYTGLLDEVAVYTNVLSASRVSAHYQAANTSGANYPQTILADNPLLYYRMNCAGNIEPDPATYPQAVNYGSASPNGLYAGGTPPGAVDGPSILGVNSSIAAPINGILSGIDAGFDPLFNPTGSQPFTAMTWFRTYPGDGLMQGIITHGNNWALNMDGSSGKLVWNLNSAGNVTSTGIVNDGAWHFAAAVFTGSSSSLYIDGALNGTIPVNNPLTSDPTNNVYLGGNAANRIVPSNERYFDGALAQAALFTNALSASQILDIYNSATTPSITLTPFGDQLRIDYTGTLLSSTNVSGPYEPVPNASSPYFTTPAGARMFYRSHNP